MTLLYEHLYDDEILNDVLDVLTLKQFLRETNLKVNDESDFNLKYLDYEMYKAIFFNSILALSDEELHQQKALSFSILLYLDKKDTQYAHYCYLILSRTNNIHQGRHLIEFIKVDNDEFLRRSDVILDFELSFNRSLAKLELPDISIHLNSFQKQLWNKLHADNKIIAISAPTSSGKSFMIQNFFIENYVKYKKINSIYIVPTKALIYEVSSNLRRRLSEYGVIIKNYVDDLDDTSDKEIYVLTPERCLNLLKNSKEKLFDIIFFDEIQNLEDGERGAIFEYVFNELNIMYPKSKIIVAGPYLKNLQLTIDKLSGIEPPLIKSNISPVYQTKAILKIKKGTEKIDVILKSITSTDIKFQISLEERLYNKLKTSHLKTIPNIVMNLGKNSINIIYAPTRYNAEQYAINIAKQISESDVSNEYERIEELISFLSYDIHPKYSLVRCLKKGVAFHHGTIPDLAKLEIEDMYKLGIIKNLCCTSTLLEGVNLPADKMFIYKAFKKNKNNPLDNFEFGNLIGRAGRANSKLNGSVYCIELDDEPWANNKLESDFSKEIIPITDRAFRYYLDELMNNIRVRSTKIMSNQSVIYTIILLRHKALKDKKELYDYLQSKGLQTNVVNDIYNDIINSLKNLQVPASLLRYNPTIDPLLQNDLYNKIVEDGIDYWLITRHPLSGEGIRSDEVSLKDKNFYHQFKEITKKMNYIFNIEGEINRPTYRGANINRIIYYAVMWMEQNPIRNMVLNELKYIGKEDEKTIDKTIRNIVRRIKDDVSYNLVKYFKLLSDIMFNIYGEEEMKKGINTMLPEMIEFGASGFDVLNMIRSGINRSAAIVVSRYIPSQNKKDPIDWLIKNDIPELITLHRRYLVNQGFWKEERLK